MTEEEAEDFEERVNEIRRQRREHPDGSLLERAQNTIGDLSDSSASDDIFGGPTSVPQNIPSSEPDLPFTVLVCTECLVYFELDGEWEFCPHCSEGLKEVERA